MRCKVGLKAEVERNCFLHSRHYQGKPSDFLFSKLLIIIIMTHRVPQGWNTEVYSVWAISTILDTTKTKQSDSIQQATVWLVRCYITQCNLKAKGVERFVVSQHLQWCQTHTPLAVVFDHLAVCLSLASTARLYTGPHGHIIIPGNLLQFVCSYYCGWKLATWPAL